MAVDNQDLRWEGLKEGIVYLKKLNQLATLPQIKIMINGTSVTFGHLKKIPLFLFAVCLISVAVGQCFQECNNRIFFGVRELKISQFI